MERKKRNKGFTLVELIVVMAIVCILAGLSLTSSFGARKVARDGRRKADLEQIRSALEMYRSDCKAYPATAAVVFGSGTLTGAEASCINNVYMDKIPNDPLSGHTYTYSGLTNSYTLCSYLETSSTSQGCGICTTGVANSCYYKVTNY